MQVMLVCPSNVSVDISAPYGVERACVRVFVCSEDRRELCGQAARNISACLSSVAYLSACY